MYTDAAGSLSFSYTLKGVVYSFDTGPGGFLLTLSSPTAGGSSQSLSVDAAAGSFELTGPPGSLFSGLDASTLHVDPAAAYTGHNYLTSSTASASFYVAMTQIAFQTTSPVPEPTTGALFVIGGALLAWRLRRRALDQGAGSRV
jgi:hypothetical protein